MGFIALFMPWLKMLLSIFFMMAKTYRLSFIEVSQKPYNLKNQLSTPHFIAFKNKNQQYQNQLDSIQGLYFERILH